MGTGIFNLPYRIEQVGVIPYVIYILASAVFSYLGMYMISRLIHRFKVVTYSDMCEQAYGKKFRKVVDAILIFYPWGVTICYQVIFAKFITQLLADVFKLELYEPGGGREKEIYTGLGIVFVM